MTRRLRKTMIEGTPRGAGNIGNQTIQYRPPGFVFIESQV